MKSNKKLGDFGVFLYTDAEEVPPAPAADESKVLDDSIECSLPSSDRMTYRLKQRLDLISNGSSTMNAAVSSSNVYNSTPIQKQFEISSESVSKITRPSVDNSHQEDEKEHGAIVADNSTAGCCSEGAGAQEGCSRNKQGICCLVGERRKQSEIVGGRFVYRGDQPVRQQRPNSTESPPRQDPS
ncbi:uncharacterized protein LOC119765459 [Culex quinquefasciatus]|uniref:uncharacterized protein LOC119765401 n=1 Tax=Culex quinquefasciatus TaxID=7176 RepID=UPI0018E37BD3|nr:uncharacterized protein LOC119765401 [Culex quinquefasciatus]XP_038105251.1 uncharacterized protein LOC119765459 [Culex quinquefasciatus]